MRIREPTRGAKRRVVASHRIAAAAFRLAAAFGIVSVTWATWVVIRGGAWWGPLHALYAGTVLLAISGATQLFTITWSAAPPPPAWLAFAQRWALVGGTATVLIGVPGGHPWPVALGAGAVAGGLLILGWGLVATIRRSLLRRFDLSTRFYLLALAAGTIGVALGAVIGSGAAGSGYLRLRTVHANLNLVGLIGLTILGTIPTFLPTLAHHRAVSGSEVRVALWTSHLGIAVIVAGLAFGSRWVGAGVLTVSAAFTVVLLGVVVRLGRRAVKGGLPYLQVTVGCGWLVAWAVTTGWRLLLEAPSPPFGPGTGAVAAAGVGQVLLGSLAYLVPVLAGPPPRLGRNLARMAALPWLPLAAANVAGIVLVLGPLGAAAAALIAVWLIDFGRRLAALEWRAT